MSQFLQHYRGASQTRVCYPTCIPMSAGSLERQLTFIEALMGTGLRLSEEAYAALLERTGSRAAPSPTAKAQSPLPPPPKPQDRMLALGRLPPGEKNPTEEAYAAHLELEKQAGLITWYAFEPIKLRLGKNTFYTPDYGVRLVSGELELGRSKASGGRMRA